MKARLMVVGLALLGLSGLAAGQAQPSKPAAEAAKATAPAKAARLVATTVPDDCGVVVALEWCSRDHGFNEGAVCGASALTGVPGVPQVIGGPILGNLWDRTAMMSLAKDAAKAGRPDAAVNAAICCQIHNNTAAQCLASHRGDVLRWLMK